MLVAAVLLGHADAAPQGIPALVMPGAPGSVNGEMTEFLYCTTLYKGSAEAGKPLLPRGPLEQLAALPTSCLHTLGNHVEQADGVKGLQGLGWRPISLSHQVTVLAPAKDAHDKAELLVSVLYLMQRTTPRFYSNPSAPQGNAR